MFFFILILYSIIVLDPRLKLQYMEDNNWEKKWIDKAKKNVLKIFNFLYLNFLIYLIFNNIYYFNR
jgi:hypothetical protein